MWLFCDLKLRGEATQVHSGIVTSSLGMRQAAVLVSTRAHALADADAYRACARAHAVARPEHAGVSRHHVRGVHYQRARAHACVPE
eukprot:scaffold58119_cov19-Tisochrysis_lutea.AAC.1